MAVDKVNKAFDENETGELHRKWERPSYAIYEAMEEWFDVNWLSHPPMIRTVDLEAVDRFFEGSGDRSLSFEYDDMCITLSRVGEHTELSITNRMETESSK